MEKFTWYDRNVCIDYSHLSIYNLDIKEKRPNRDGLLYENFDPDLSLILKKFKNDAKKILDEKNCCFKNKKAFSLNEFDKIEHENNTNSIESKPLENKILSENDSKAVEFKSSKSCFENENKFISDKIENFNKKFKRVTSFPTENHKCFIQSNSKSTKISLKETKPKLKTISSKENIKSTPKPKATVAIKVKKIQANQVGNILNSRSISISRQMSLDSKLKQFNKTSGVLSHHRENAKNNIYKNIEKKLKNLNEKRNENELRKIVEYFENGLYKNFMENYEKYRKKIISICSNICDINNDTFYKKILNYEIDSESLARMETLAMASENKIKQRELEKEKDLKVIQKIAEDNQTNNRIIKKTHKGEIEIELYSPKNSNFEENIECSKRETNKIFPEILPVLPELSYVPNILGPNFTDRSDSGLFSDEDTCEKTGDKPSKLTWPCHFKFELDSSFLNVLMLSNLKNTFASKIENLFFKPNLSLEIENFDSFRVKSGDLMVQLKHVINKNDLVFVKFEKSNKTYPNFYNKLYNYLVKQQSSVDNRLFYARMNLNKEHSEFINNFYLLPLKKKNVLQDENLKKLFSIDVERTRDSILGVFVSDKIQLKTIGPPLINSSLTVDSSNFSDPDNVNTFWLKFKDDLEHQINIYEYLMLFFQRITKNDWFNNMNFRRELILFFTEFDRLNDLTDEQRINLKERFFEKLPDLIFIIIRSSPNNLINIESLHDIIQTCLDTTNVKNNENIIKQDDKSDPLVQTHSNSHLNSDSNEIELISDDEIEFPIELNKISKSDIDLDKENLENVNDEDSISYVSDDEIDVNFENHQKPLMNNPKEYECSNTCENVKFHPETFVESPLIEREHEFGLDILQEKSPLTSDQEKTFEYKIVQFEKKRNQSTYIPEDIRIVNFKNKIPTVKPSNRNHKRHIFTQKIKINGCYNIKRITDHSSYEGFLKRNSFKANVYKFNKNFFVK